MESIQYINAPLYSFALKPFHLRQSSYLILGSCFLLFPLLRFVPFFIQIRHSNLRGQYLYMHCMYSFCSRSKCVTS